MLLRTDDSSDIVRRSRFRAMVPEGWDASLVEVLILYDDPVGENNLYMT